MNSGPHPLVTGRGLLCAYAHGVQYDEAGKSIDEIARDCNGTSGAYRDLLAPHPAGRKAATYQAAANTAYVRSCSFRPRSDDRAATSTPTSTPSKVFYPQDRIVSRPSTLEPAGDWESNAPPVADPEEVLRPNASPTTGARAVTDPKLPLPDVSLIVEDLLVRAKQLAESGARPEAIEALLDHVAALREGRG